MNNCRPAVKEAACNVCGSKDITLILELKDVPVHCNILWPTKDEAVHAPKGDIRLNFCNDCGHVFNHSFDPDLMTYTQTYENSLHFSGHFSKYAESLARKLLERYDLYGKHIIEIGCGKGDFLKLLCDLGGNYGIGFDPSYEHDRGGRSPADRLVFIRDYYSEQYSKYKADLVCCRHVLEHINTPVDFMKNLRHIMNENQKAKVFFEVPNVNYTLEDMGIWDLIYEHCSYFSADSLSRLFSLCGFRVTGISAGFNNQMLQLDAVPADSTDHNDGNSQHGIRKTDESVNTFSEKYRKKVRYWNNYMKKLSQRGERTVVWGGGSKGVTFLNMLKIEDQIEYIVDINPHKHGKHAAGTGQKIVPPELLKEYMPGVVIVMNPAYTDEISEILADNNINANIIAA